MSVHKNKATKEIMTIMGSIMRELWNLFIKQKYYILSIFIIFTILACFDLKIGKEAYFYTLSTISQTLAALIGIVAIFVIFELEIIKTEKNNLIRSIANLLKTDLSSSAYSNSTDKYHKEIRRIIQKAYVDFTIDDLNDISSTIANFDSNVIHSDAMKELIGRVGEKIENVRKIEAGIEKIPLDFVELVKVVFSTIILSILALPLGWFTIPIDILSNLSILKLPLVAFIIYLTVLSIIQTYKFLENVVKSQY